MQDVGVAAGQRKVLSDEQITAFDEDGFLSVGGFLSSEWMDRLTATTAEIVEESRSCNVSNEKFDLEPDHTAQNPRLRRLQKPQDQHPLYHEVAFSSPIVDVVEDLLGPDLKFHHGKLNFKWSGGGAEIKWHQDIPFWPHTAYNVVTVGIALDDIDETVGPMGVVKSSHKGPVYDHYGPDGTWRGYIDDKDVETINLNDATYLKGPAGTITVHHCRSVHGSMPNNHPTRARPFLLFAYSAANCLPLMPYNQDSAYNGAIVRGRHPDYPVFEGEPCKLPPLRSKTSKYRSIFASQQAEEVER